MPPLKCGWMIAGCYARENLMEWVCSECNLLSSNCFPHRLFPGDHHQLPSPFCHQSGPRLPNPLFLSARRKACGRWFGSWVGNNGLIALNTQNCSSVPTQPLQGDSILVPDCEYTMRLGDVNGPPAPSTVKVGDLIYHRWECQDSRKCRIQHLFLTASHWSGVRHAGEELQGLRWREWQCNADWRPWVSDQQQWSHSKSPGVQRLAEHGLCANFRVPFPGSDANEFSLPNPVLQQNGQWMCGAYGKIQYYGNNFGGLSLSRQTVRKAMAQTWMWIPDWTQPTATTTMATPVCNHTYHRRPVQLGIIRPMGRTHRLDNHKLIWEPG